MTHKYPPWPCHNTQHLTSVTTRKRIHHNRSRTTNGPSTESTRELPRRTPGAGPNDTRTGRAESGPRCRGSVRASSTGCHTGPSMRDLSSMTSRRHDDGSSYQSPGWYQRRYISKRSPVHTKHALAGRAGLRDGRHQRQARLGGWAGRGIPPTSPRATTRLPGGRPDNPARGEQGCCPRGAAWSGDARTTGCHTGSQRGRTVSASATLPGHRRTLKSLVNTPIAAARTRREPVDGFRIGPSVGRLSERNNAQ
jgi:hypothetical protein